MRMQNLWCSVVVMMVTAGCFAPTDTLVVGSLDSGQPGLDAGGTGGGGGGGQLGGGGGNTGGGGGMDGGHQLSDAGLVAQLPPLPEAKCGQTIPNRCTNDGGCLHFLGVDGGSETVATFARGNSFVYGAAGGGVLYQADSNATIWHAVPGRGPFALRPSSFMQGLSITPKTIAESPSYGFWFIMEERESGPAARKLMLAPNLAGTASVTNTLEAVPSSNGVAVGTTYFIGLRDGLYSYYPAGGSRVADITSVTGQPEEILAIASDDVREVFFLQCTNPYASGQCSLWKYESPLNANPSKTMLVQELPSLGSGVASSLSLRVVGDWVYVLGVRYLLRLPRAGGALEVVYRGEEFPQYTGTLKAGSLEAIGGKLYFGSVCHFDADLPGYGTIELDPVSMTARWLDLDPRWPVVPHVTGYEPWDSYNGPWATAQGTFLLGP